MAEARLPPALRRELERTGRPVRPLAPPSRRVLAILPCAIALLVLVPIVWGLRTDRDAIGIWRLWGASLVQLVLAVAVSATAIAESIPGRLPARRTIAAISAAAVAIFLGTTLVTFAASATVVPTAHASLYFWICVSHPFALGLPALLVLGFLAARGLTSRPALVGGLAGLGAGLISDASWRLYCHVSDPGHVLVAHAGALAALTLLGAALGALLSRVFPRPL